MSKKDEGWYFRTQGCIATPLVLALLLWGLVAIPLVLLGVL